MCVTRNEFEAALNSTEETKFRPYGELLKSYTVSGEYCAFYAELISLLCALFVVADQRERQFELYHLNLDPEQQRHEHHTSVESKTLHEYLHRMQSFAFWCVFEICYTNSKSSLSNSQVR